MDVKEMLRHVDHTQLQAFCTWEDIEKLCKEAIEFETASVCIPPAYVKMVNKNFGDKLNICTVIGFPNGNYTTEVKVFETKDALINGADEIDMVINVGMLKAGEYDYVLGLEPGNCYPDGRDVMREKGMLEFLKPDEEKVHHITFEFIEKN